MSGLRYVYDKSAAIEFFIAGKLPTLNEYTLAQRRNKYAGAAMKTKATDICAVAASEIKKLPNCRYDMLLVWNLANQKTDPDNLYFAVKFILDGLVKSGRLANDGCAQVGKVAHEWIQDRSQPVGVTVLLL
jgi:hypothetical protein